MIPCAICDSNTLELKAYIRAGFSLFFFFFLFFPSLHDFSLLPLLYTGDGGSGSGSGRDRRLRPDGVGRTNGCGFSILFEATTPFKQAGRSKVTALRFTYVRIDCVCDRTVTVPMGGRLFCGFLSQLANERTNGWMDKHFSFCPGEVGKWWKWKNICVG